MSDELPLHHAPVPLDARVAAITALSDPARRVLYEFVSRSAESVSRDAAAESAGLSRSTTAFHLDRLASLGLVSVEYKRLSGRTGPGAGRPAKLYGRTETELSYSLPARHYDLASELLASAIENGAAAGTTVQEALRTVANDAGRMLAASSSSLAAALEDNGFEPRADGADFVLGNCPFDRLAANHRALVCTLNRELIQGMAAGVADDAHAICTDPNAGRCCIRISSRTAIPEIHSTDSQESSS